MTRSGLGSTTTRVMGAAILVGLALVVWLAFVVSGPDTELGETVRLLYVHVPSAITLYLACAVTFAGSLGWLVRRSRWWDLVALAGGELALLFAGLTLATGMVWGRPTWGTFWVWDPRLTSTALLALMLVGYLTVRRTSDDPEVGSTRAAVVGLLLIPNVLLVNRSVEWWRSLHQDPTIVSLDPKIEGWQLTTWFAATVLALLVLAWLLVLRFRLAWLADRAAAGAYDRALRERQAEAGHGVGRTP